METEKNCLIRVISWLDLTLRIIRGETVGQKSQLGLKKKKSAMTEPQYIKGTHKTATPLRNNNNSILHRVLVGQDSLDLVLPCPEL